MEADARHQTRKNIRRERAQRMLQERRQQLQRDEKQETGKPMRPFSGNARGVRDNDSEVEDGPIERSARPPRPQPKKKKEPLYEEDLIDGFSIVSFKSYDDLGEVGRYMEKFGSLPDPMHPEMKRKQLQQEKEKKRQKRRQKLLEKSGVVPDQLIVKKENEESLKEPMDAPGPSRPFETPLKGLRGGNEDFLPDDFDARKGAVRKLDDSLTGKDLCNSLSNGGDARKRDGYSSDPLSRSSSVERGYACDSDSGAESHQGKKVTAGGNGSDSDFFVASRKGLKGNSGLPGQPEQPAVVDPPMPDVRSRVSGLPESRIAYDVDVMRKAYGLPVGQPYGDPNGHPRSAPSSVVPTSCRPTLPEQPPLHYPPTSLYYWRNERPHSAHGQFYTQPNPPSVYGPPSEVPKPPQPPRPKNPFSIDCLVPSTESNEGLNLSVDSRLSRKDEHLLGLPSYARASPSHHRLESSSPMGHHPYTKPGHGLHEDPNLRGHDLRGTPGIPGSRSSDRPPSNNRASVTPTQHESVMHSTSPIPHLSGKSDRPQVPPIPVRNGPENVQDFPNYSHGHHKKDSVPPSSTPSSSRRSPCVGSSPVRPSRAPSRSSQPETKPSTPGPATVRTEMHHHQHQHNHQHTHLHQHTATLLTAPGATPIPPMPVPGSHLGLPLPPTALNPSFFAPLPSQYTHMKDPKMAALESPFYRPGGSLFMPHPHHPGDASAPGMSVPGAMQMGVGLGPSSPAFLPPMVPGRAPIGLVTSNPSSAPTSTPFNPPSQAPPTNVKKHGKWNCMHVRIAWEIHNRQLREKAKDKSVTIPHFSIKGPSIPTVPTFNPSGPSDPLGGSRMSSFPSMVPTSAGPSRPPDSALGVSMPIAPVPGTLGPSKDTLTSDYLGGGISPFLRLNAYGSSLPPPPGPPSSNLLMSQMPSRDPSTLAMQHDVWARFHSMGVNGPLPPPPNLFNPLHPYVLDREREQERKAEQERELRRREEEERQKRERERAAKERERKEREEKEAKEREEKEKKLKAEREREQRERERAKERERSRSPLRGPVPPLLNPMSYFGHPMAKDPYKFPGSYADIDKRAEMEYLLKTGRMPPGQLTMSPFGLGMPPDLSMSMPSASSLMPPPSASSYLGSLAAASSSSRVPTPTSASKPSVSSSSSKLPPSSSPYHFSRPPTSVPSSMAGWQLPMPTHSMAEQAFREAQYLRGSNPLEAMILQEQYRVSYANALLPPASVIDSFAFDRNKERERQLFAAAAGYPPHMLHPSAAMQKPMHPSFLSAPSNAPPPPMARTSVPSPMAGLGLMNLPSASGVPPPPLIPHGLARHPAPGTIPKIPR